MIMPYEISGYLADSEQPAYRRYSSFSPKTKMYFGLLYAATIVAFMALGILKPNDGNTQDKIAEPEKLEKEVGQTFPADSLEHNVQQP